MARQAQDGSDQFGRFHRAADEPEFREAPPKPRFPHPIPIRAAGLSCDRKILVALDAQGFVNGWNAVTAKRLYRLPLLDSQEVPQRLTFSPDGRFVALSPDSELLACSDGPQLRRWALKSGAELPRFTEAEQPLKWTAWSPKGDVLVASRESSSAISIWEDDGRPSQLRILKTKDEAPASLAFS